MQNFKIFILGFCLLLFTDVLHSQTSQVEFGKNRVQFHEDFAEWAMYESENFVTYWYGQGRPIGQAVVQMAETDFLDIQTILEHRINDKIDIIVYKDLTDLKQSNIGVEEVFFNTGGKTKIVGNKIFVHFDGNHNNLRRSVREGVASAYLNAMMFGANLQEVVQNAVLLNLPEWFKDGLVSYAGESWNVHNDDRLREIILSKRYKKFEDFADEYPKLAGHSMWYFISQNYGKSVAPNLLYLTRINRSIESGFAFVLGDTYEASLDNWLVFYNKRYRAEIKGLEKPKGRKVEIKNRRKLPVSNLKLSPDGKKIAYVLNEIGKVRVFIQDIRTGERTQILKYGSRNPFQETDYNYPLLAWSPNNLELGIIYEQRDIIKIIQRDLNTGNNLEDVMPNQFHRINSMDYVNPFKMVFSATVGGVSDIFTFIPKTRQSIRITHDFWDDLDAKFVKVDGHKGILFSSNRADTMLVTGAKLDSILPINTFDIFHYNLENPSKELTRVTRTPFANERNPNGVDSTWFSYTSDASGVYNQNMGYLETYLAWNNQAIYLNDGSEIIIREDSVWNNVDSIGIDSIVIQPVYKKRGVTHNQTNYNTHLIRHNIAGKVNKQIILYRIGYNHKIYLQDVDTLKSVKTYTTIFRNQSLSEAGLKLISNQNTSGNDQQSTEIIPKEEEEIIEDYLFQSEFDDEEKPSLITFEEDEGNIVIEPTLSVPSSPSWDENKVHKFRQHRIVPYHLQFRTDFITTTIDNSLLFGGLNNYAGTPQGSDFPPPGILLKANFKDLFEDYVLEGGIRIPTTFNGAEYYVFLDNKKKKLDKRFAAYRRSIRRNGVDIAPPPVPSDRFVEPRNRETSFLTQMELRYPLDIFRSIRATTTLRFDRQTQLATDQSALNTSTDKQQRLGLRLEYVFDNTLDVDINIKNGTRYKFHVEVLKRFEIDFIDGFDFDLNQGFMTVIGFDARHYQRLDKHSILAIRAAGSTSLGSERILYLLGGVDNWLFSSFNNDIPLPASEGFAYQTFANNIRGFRSNIRNGNSYALINTELRVPIFKYFSRRIKSSFFRSFQLVGFFDIGTAWEGLSPYSDDNPLNITTVSNGAVTLSINYFRDPIVMGYGGGIRAMLFGYFMKLDYAWGVESRVTQDPRLYFSIGKDF